MIKWLSLMMSSELSIFIMIGLLPYYDITDFTVQFLFLNTEFLVPLINLYSPLWWGRPHVQNVNIPMQSFIDIPFQHCNPYISNPIDAMTLIFLCLIILRHFLGNGIFRKTKIVSMNPFFKYLYTLTI